MAIFDGFLICSDFDGTLAQNANVSEANVRAVEYFMRNGGLFTLCTGRTFSFIKEKIHFLPNAPMLTVNGTVICNAENGEHIKTWSIGYELAEFCRDIMLKYSEQVEKVYLVSDITGEMLWLYHHDVQEVLPRLKNERFNKAVIRVNENASDCMLETITNIAGKRFNVSRSWVKGIELQSADSSKGIAVDFLKSYLQPYVHTLICVGDYENDISMLKRADISYAVGDASEMVKSSAGRVCVPCKDDAIADIIYGLEKELNINKA